MMELFTDNSKRFLAVNYSHKRVSSFHSEYTFGRKRTDKNVISVEVLCIGTILPNIIF